MPLGNCCSCFAVGAFSAATVMSKLAENHRREGRGHVLGQLWDKMAYQERQKRLSLYNNICYISLC